LFGKVACVPLDRARIVVVVVVVVVIVATAARCE
jgi:hypothetical protein